MYLMTFSQEQLDSDRSIELRLKDKSKKDGDVTENSEGFFKNGFIFV